MSKLLVIIQTNHPPNCNLSCMMKNVLSIRLKSSELISTRL